MVFNKLYTEEKLPNLVKTTKTYSHNFSISKTFRAANIKLSKLANIKLSLVNKNLITIIKSLNLAETTEKYFHESQHFLKCLDMFNLFRSS